MATNNSDLMLHPETGDLLLTNNDLTLITSNLDSVRQRLALKFSIWKNEWQFDISFGFDYLSYIGKKVSKSIIDAKVKQTALSPSDVLRIENFNSSFSKRFYEAYFTVVTTELEEVNIAFFGIDEFSYPSPESLENEICPVEGQIELGGKLYHFINFRLPFNQDSTWINEWQGLYKDFRKISWNSLLQWSQQGITWGGNVEF